MRFTKCLLLSATLATITAGCGDQSTTPPAPAANAGGHTHDAGGHTHDDGHTHAPTTAAGAEGHDGPVLSLGSAAAGPFTVTATRVQGAIEAGKDSPIYATVTAAAPAKATAVRFWIGTADAKGSTKAKAAVENPAEPDRWHTHAEVPDPLTADAKLYVEIEAAAGGRQTAGFDLKR